MVGTTPPTQDCVGWWLEFFAVRNDFSRWEAPLRLVRYSYGINTCLRMLPLIQNARYQRSEIQQTDCNSNFGRLFSVIFCARPPTTFLHYYNNGVRQDLRSMHRAVCAAGTSDELWRPKPAHSVSCVSARCQPANSNPPQTIAGHIIDLSGSGDVWLKVQADRLRIQSLN